MNSDANNNSGSPPKRQRRDNRQGRGRGRGGREKNDAGRGNSGGNRRRRNNGRRNVSKDNEINRPLDPSINDTEESVASVVNEVVAEEVTIAEPTSRHQFSTTLFTQCDISSPSLRALSEVLKYSYMTKVQEATLPSILQNRDVVAKAKTGSGKTTGFLLPILEKLMTTPADEFITAVVLSPTRELTQQIATEFQKLATFHLVENKVYISMIGGTNIEKDKRALKQKSKLRLLLATPGRLLDHLNQNTANIVKRLSRVQILCLDEADRLLDMGFRDALKSIIGYMPREHDHGGRQTLLFSATFPASLKSMTDLSVKAAHEFIDTLDEDEVDANVQVLQQSMVVPLQHHILAMQQILQQHIEECKAKKQSYKIIVFFTTARIAGFMAELFLAKYPQSYSNKNLWEIHSRKNQTHRMRVAQKFTDGSNCLLFSSDVSARGVDYPNVSFVLQVGAPSEKAQYIHRLGKRIVSLAVLTFLVAYFSFPSFSILNKSGRTARAGNAGTGVLLLCDFERVFLKEVCDLDITALKSPAITETEDTAELHAMQQLMQSNDKLRGSAAAAYQAFMGYYNSNVKRLKLQNKHELVKVSNEFATMLGFPEGEPPALLAKTVGKMGLKGLPGIRIDREGGAGRGGGGRGRGGRGNGGGRGH